MATHLIFDLQGTPHLATETEEGFLTQSGIIENKNIRTTCPVGQLENRVTRFGAGDEVFHKILEEVDTLRPETPYHFEAFHDMFTADGRQNFKHEHPTLIHLSEAVRLGLIQPKP